MATSLLSACIKPAGEWHVSQGVSFKEENLAEIREGVTPAGAVIAKLGVPYTTKPDEFIYAVQRRRNVERSFFFFSRAYTEQVTVRTVIRFDDGVVSDVETQRVEQLIPR